ncbi:protein DETOXIFICATION 10-like [Zingiber officinale]|uniref:protein DETOXIFICATION 10-like n=1 Tax=Zingiber officinale TaxID=94328 RepID=UPI001C4DC189|nr:protein DETOXIFICATION 10-like [Zingiber officinale]
MKSSPAFLLPDRPGAAEREMEEQLIQRDGPSRRWWCCGEATEEARRIAYVAAPMVGVLMSQFLVQVSSTMVVGHLGELNLAAAAIAFSLANVSGFSVLVGMASGLETLCGQAYGAKQYHSLGVYTYRAIFSLLMVCLPISLVWASMGKLLQIVGQDPAISQEAERYAIWMIPGLFAYAITQPLMKFLQSQSLIFPMLLSSVSTLCFHVLFCWLLVYKSSLYNVGAAVSLSISYWLNVLILILYIRYSDSCRLTRSPITKEAFKGIYEFLRVAVPSTLMMCLEWWSYELLILLSGLLPYPKLETSVLSICLNSVSLLYSIPYGLGCAASTRVSNELGASNPSGAKLAVLVSMLLAVLEAALVLATLLALRSVLGYAYSNEKVVVNYVYEMVPMVCLTVFTDSISGILSGVARGSGWQHLGAYVNLGAFYLVGIPVSILLGFALHLRGKGLWVGIMCGSITQSILLAVITSFTNWEHQVKLARERVLHEDYLYIMN